MGSPECNGDSTTVVWAHSNMSMHGKGVWLKSHDFNGAFCCSGCHDWYDRRVILKDDVADRVHYFHKAHAGSLYILVRDGILKT